jgi:predicted RNA-binding protein with PUA-like domain
MAFWLIKSEPLVYGLEQLEADRITAWDGIRNHQAAGFLRQMQPGDLAFFYHSSTAIPAIVGLARVVEVGLSDPSQFDPHSPYYDPRSQPEQPRWPSVRIAFVERLAREISLHELRTRFTPEAFWVVRRGNRLSVLPVSELVAQQLLAMGRIAT